MKHDHHRGGTMGGARHTWFVAFERAFQQQLAGPLTRPRWVAFQIGLSENEWRVWMYAPGRHALTLSIDLPPDYSAIQPLSAALTTAQRLRGMADAGVAQAS